MYLLKVIVEGSGFFPGDMLRYDGAHPATSADVDKIFMNHSNSEPGEWKARRQVTLYMVVRLNKPEGATLGRWRSFGWTVLKQEIIGGKL